MNTFGTRCPSCLTSFKVNTDLLRLQDGHAACGQCGTVFDMQAALFLLPPHTTSFIKHPFETDGLYPELNAVITTTVENLSQTGTELPNTKLQTPHIQVTPTAPVAEQKAPDKKPPENITFYSPDDTKPIIDIHNTGKTQTNPKKIDVQTVTFRSQPILPKSSNKTWLATACWILFAGACIQIAGLFSREISRSIPTTRILYEQLNLPTDHG